MTRVFEGGVSVAYSQAYVESPGRYMADMESCFAGQRNGLCGAGEPGVLFLTTGLHTGEVPFAVDVLDKAPVVGEDWEDVVEVSFVTDEPVVGLAGWAGGSYAPIPLGASGSFRVRYNGFGMDAARQQDTRLMGEPVLDRYLLQFWPSDPADDAIVRQSSQIARYWHDYANRLPPPPTPEERATLERVAAEEQARADAAAQAAAELSFWGGRLPSDRLRALGISVHWMVESQRELLELFDSLDAQDQRRAARWLVHRTFELAEIDTIDWVVPALDAMDRGEALPGPFNDITAAFRQLRGGAPTTATIVMSRESPRERPPIHRPSFAIPAIFAAVEPDPLQALVGTLFHAAATFDERKDELFTKLRATLPDSAS